MTAPNSVLKKNCWIKAQASSAQPHGMASLSSTYIQSQIKSVDCSLADKMCGYLKYHRQKTAIANPVAIAQRQ